MSRLHFKVLNTPLAGTELTLDPPGGILGRSRTVEVSVRYAGLSGQHARFQWEAARGWLVSDAGSTNGTWLNGKPLDDTPQALGTKGQVSCADLELSVWTEQNLRTEQSLWTEPLASPVRVESAPETMVYGVSLFKSEPAENASAGGVIGPGAAVKQAAPAARPSTLASLALDLLDPDVPAQATPARPLPDVSAPMETMTAAPVSLMHGPTPHPPTPHPPAPHGPTPHGPTPVSLFRDPVIPPRSAPHPARPMPETQELVVKALPPLVEPAPETQLWVVNAVRPTPTNPEPPRPTPPPPRVEPAPETQLWVVNAVRPAPTNAEPPRPTAPPPRLDSERMPEGQALRALVREGRALADALGETLEVLAHGLSTGAHREKLEQTLEEASLRLADFRSRLEDGLGGTR